MRAVLSILVLVSLSSCLQIGKQSDSGSSADAGSASAAGASSSGGASATGTNCGVDPSSGVTLCLGISSCPSVRVDPDQFPDCGYRILGNRIDLECLCGDSLCPMGSAASCLDAARADVRRVGARGVRRRRRRALSGREANVEYVDLDLRQRLSQPVWRRSRLPQALWLLRAHESLSGSLSRPLHQGRAGERVDRIC